MKSTIASRTSNASSTKFYKSYVKNVVVAEVRDNGCNRYNAEVDYLFDYKGEQYRVNAHRVGGIYSAKFEYSLEHCK